MMVDELTLDTSQPRGRRDHEMPVPVTRPVFLVFAIPCLMATALAATASEEILAVDAARREAMIAGDASSMEDVLAAGLTYTHSNALVQTKTDLMNAIETGVMDYQRIDVQDVDVSSGEGWAILTGSQHIELRFKGRPIKSESRFTAIYGRTADGWQLQAYQSTTIPPPPLPSSPATLAAVEFLEIYNTHDVAATQQLVADDVQWLGLRGAAVALELEGREALGPYLEGYFTQLPTVRSEFEKSFSVGNYVAFRERVTWGESHEKTQAALGVMQFEAGKVQRVWYFPASE